MGGKLTNVDQRSWRVHQCETQRLFIVTANHPLGSLSAFLIARMVLPGLLFWLGAFFFKKFGPRILVADVLVVAFYYFTFGLGFLLLSRVGGKHQNIVRENSFAVIGVILATVLIPLASGYGFAEPAFVAGVALNTLVAGVVVIVSAFVGGRISRHA